MDVLLLIGKAFAVLCGTAFLLFAVVFVVVALGEAKREERVKQLEEEHYKASTAETAQRIHILNRAKRHPHGSPEHMAIMEQYFELEKVHDKNWNLRVKKIIDTQIPVDVEEECRRRGWW